MSSSRFHTCSLGARACERGGDYESRSLQWPGQWQGWPAPESLQRRASLLLYWLWLVISGQGCRVIEKEVRSRSEHDLRSSVVTSVYRRSRDDRVKEWNANVLAELQKKKGRQLQGVSRGFVSAAGGEGSKQGADGEDTSGLASGWAASNWTPPGPNTGDERRKVNSA